MKYKLFIAVLFYKLNILPKRYKNQIYGYLEKQKIETKYFLNAKLEWHDEGYWALKSMISYEELNEYYSFSYWSNRGGVSKILTERDISHSNMLNKFIFNQGNKKLRVMNFGAGHGGISHLFHAAGHEVVNIEKGEVTQFYNERWSVVSDIGLCTGKFDLIYSSHSLEHVWNLNDFLCDLGKLCNNNTYFFFEVPNCRSLNKPLVVSCPHTYYFTKDFFNVIGDHVIFNSTFNRLEIAKGESGNVIRALFQGLTVEDAGNTGP
jgi:2-polyprenyl-3-methyl-5-hydroxy-6-metoxy-1,4-benzoquinol methylase